MSQDFSDEPHGALQPTAATALLLTAMQAGDRDAALTQLIRLTGAMTLEQAALPRLGCALLPSASAKRAAAALEKLARDGPAGQAAEELRALACLLDQAAGDALVAVLVP